MSSVRGDLKEGAVSLKRGLELVEFLLESAEIEYLNVNGKTIELNNGVIFLFNDSEELVDIYIE